MSDLFKVEDEKINSDRRPYRLNPDLMAGFKQAVRNNQPNLALEYLSHIMDIVEDILSQGEAESSPVEPAQAQPRKSAKAKTAEATDAAVEE